MIDEEQAKDVNTEHRHQDSLLKDQTITTTDYSKQLSRKAWKESQYILQSKDTLKPKRNSIKCAQFSFLWAGKRSKSSEEHYNHLNHNADNVLTIGKHTL